MKHVLIAILSLLLGSCARQGNLSGGVKDSTPPKVDSLKSTPNYLTQFKQQRIELTFDEWVVLKDATKEILISPPTEKRPTFYLKKKTVVVDFGEDVVFRPNTTYTINFGGAVRDLHEGNQAKELRYVFSTGLAIDSLEVEGVATDAVTGEGLENVTVMLYDLTYDSIVMKEKPYYFTKTAKGGAFSIKNVKPGSFKLVAIDEGQASDLKWNATAEKIGYADSLVTVSDSMKRAAVLVTVFKNQGVAKTTEKNAANYGVVRIGWTDTPPKDAGIVVNSKAQAANIQYFVENYKDTTLVWYDFPQDTLAPAWALSIQDTTNTVQIKAQKRNEFVVRHRLRPAEEGGGGGSSRSRGGKLPPPPAPTQLAPKNIPILPSRVGTLRFNYPISTADTSKWMAKLDSLPFRDYTLTKDSAQSRVLQINGNWKPGANIAITVLPGGLLDFYGLVNVDTLRYTVSVMTDKQLGALNLTVEETKPGMSYVLEVLNGNVTEIERRFTATDTSVKFQFKDMLAANYTVKLIEDRNANGRWDTGNYFAHQQPELIFTKKLEALRANWELEASIKAAKDDGRRK